MLDTINMVGQGAQLLQTHRNFESESLRAKRMHEEACKLAREQHERDILLLKQTYLLDVYINLEQHFQQLNADLIASSRESERDMFDQRNQQYQTIILSSSVMFSALSTVIVQGFLPVNSNAATFETYAFFTALSFACLFISIVLCIEVVGRASKFMYNRAHKQTKELSDAIKVGQKMVDHIKRGAHISDKDSPAEDAPTTDAEGLPFLAESRKRQILAKTNVDIDKLWENHEKFVHKYLEKRDKINKRRVVNREEDSTFEEYWVMRCKVWGDWAIRFFYAGSVFLLVSILIFMWAEFYTTYKNKSGAAIAVAFLGFSLVLGMVVFVGLRLTGDNGSTNHLQGQSMRYERAERGDEEEGWGVGRGQGGTAGVRAPLVRANSMESNLSELEANGEGEGANVDEVKAGDEHEQLHVPPSTRRWLFSPPNGTI